MADEDLCPVCCEPLDVTDKSFVPCLCGYQMCLWCWQKVRDELKDRCPNCRQPYDKERFQFKAPNPEEIAKQKARKVKEKAQERNLNSRKHLRNIRVIQRNLVYAIGIPVAVAKEETLKRSDYFGKFGKVVKIVVNRNTLHNLGSQSGPTCSAYVTYQYDDDAVACIKGLEAPFDPRSAKMAGIRGSFGTTKYCSYWLRFLPCNNPECMYLHELGQGADSFTKEDLTEGKHIQAIRSYLHSDDESDMSGDDTDSDDDNDDRDHTSDDESLASRSRSISPPVSSQSIPPVTQQHHEPALSAPTTSKVVPPVSSHTNPSKQVWRAVVAQPTPTLPVASTQSGLLDDSDFPTLGAAVAKPATKEAIPVVKESTKKAPWAQPEKEKTSEKPLEKPQKVTPPPQEPVPVAPVSKQPQPVAPTVAADTKENVPVPTSVKPVRVSEPVKPAVVPSTPAPVVESKEKKASRAIRAPKATVSETTSLPAPVQSAPQIQMSEPTPLLPQGLTEELDFDPWRESSLGLTQILDTQRIGPPQMSRASQSALLLQASQPISAPGSRPTISAPPGFSTPVTNIPIVPNSPSQSRFGFARESASPPPMESAQQTTGPFSSVSEGEALDGGWQNTLRALLPNVNITFSQQASQPAPLQQPLRQQPQQVPRTGSAPPGLNMPNFTPFQPPSYSPFMQPMQQAPQQQQPQPWGYPGGISLPTMFSYPPQPSQSQWSPSTPLAVQQVWGGGMQMVGAQPAPPGGGTQDQGGVDPRGFTDSAILGMEGMPLSMPWLFGSYAYAGNPPPGMSAPPGFTKPIPTVNPSPSLSEPKISPTTKPTEKKKAPVSRK